VTEPDPARMKDALERIIAGLEPHLDDPDVPPGLSPATVLWLAKRGLSPDEWEWVRDD
jgi:hypothetical protein